MFKLSEYTFIAAILVTGLAFLVYVGYVLSGIRAARLASAGGPLTTTSVSWSSGPRATSLARYGTLLGWLGLALLTISLVLRTIVTGHGPFSNMYEFSAAFSWGILVAYYWFERKYHQRVLALLVLPVVVAIMMAAAAFPSTVEPLVPALQNNLLLTVHVAVAIIAYGSFTVAFAAALLYLIQPETGRWGLPKPEILDEIGYRAIVVGFPFLTLTVVLGALWADQAWGSYWSWDPKETASLVTWLIYGAYLHARVVRGWRGRKAAWLLMAGFAATIFTYFGINLQWFGIGKDSLHSYSGLN